MKKIALLILLSLFVFTGCQDDSSILEPTNSYSIDELSKGRPIFNYYLDDFKLFDNSDSSTTTAFSKKEDAPSEQFRGLPINIKTTISQNLTIDGELGGVVFLTHKWKNTKNEQCKLSAKLDIPIGAFSGELTFEIIFDHENFAAELYPSPYTFDKPVLLDLVFINVDLTDFDPNVFVFDYLDGDEPENLTVQSIDINLDTNKLSVKNAELHHFSRYGWTRTKTTR